MAVMAIQLATIRLRWSREEEEEAVVVVEVVETGLLLPRTMR